MRVTRGRLSSCVMFILLAGIAVPILGANPAWATCSGSATYGHVSAKNHHNPTYGSKMDVYVNDFDTHQEHTWRSITAWQNSNNFAEVGWTLNAAYYGDQLDHPYKTRKNNGVVSEMRPAVSLSPRDELHTFSVKDINDDNQYQSYYDGNEIGSSWFVSIDPSLAESQTQSERDCTADSLWSQYRNLQYFSSGGNGHDWADKTNNDNTNNSPYNYCNVGAAAYDVKQTC
jgi:hypothetical protein